MIKNTEYAGVGTYLKGRFRTLEGPETTPHAHLDNHFSGVTREEFSAASHMPEVVTRFLCQIDMKMDAVLAALREEHLDEDFPHLLEVRSISASAITFTTPLPLAVGDWLEVIINLAPGGFITTSAIGSVTQRMPTPAGDLFTLSFARIAEEEQEKIIRFVFTEERKSLRQQRLG